jgi:hypothetical protein
MTKNFQRVATAQESNGRSTDRSSEDLTLSRVATGMADFPLLAAPTILEDIHR